jgi:hypothetical protein
VDVVLGVSMGSTAIRMVVVEGEHADGATVDEDDFHADHTDASGPDDAATGSPTQVLSAILGTREGAAEGGYALTSTGVVCNDPTEAAALRDALAAYKVENVMLVSAFVAASALAQAMAQATGCSRTATLLVEPDNATLGIVDADDGSVTVVRTQPLTRSGHTGELEADAVAELADMVTGDDTLQARPEGVFVVGDDVDIAPLKPALEAATRLRVSAPEEPETALARGAALASANAPLSTSTTPALAYSQEPGTDDLYRYLSVPDASDTDGEPIAYSSVPDPETDAETTLLRATVGGGPNKNRQRHGPTLLVGSAVAATIVIALVALEVALAINIRTTVALQPSPQQNLIVPSTPPAAPAHPPPLHAAALLAPQPAPSVPNRVKAPVPADPAPAAQPAPAPAAQAVPVPAAAPPPMPPPVDPLPLLFPFPVGGPLPAAPPVPNFALPQLALPPAPPIALPNPPALIPAPPVQLPVPPPVQLPTPPPVQLPTPPPVQLPTPPPVQLPKPPAQLPVPKPPAQLPTPAVQLPKPPVQLPAPVPPPVQLPAPQVQLPKPPIQLPTAPTPPVQLPVPQVQLPKPPVQLPAAPAPPVLPLPLPKPPAAPALPLPAAPALPALPAAPALPALPANPLIPKH